MTMDDIPHFNDRLLVAIGASAGGLREIVTIVESLPTWFAGTLVVATHRDPRSPNILAEILAKRASIRVDEPTDEAQLECTTIYVGKANERVEVDQEEFSVETDSSSYARLHRIDDLFTSVAKSAGKDAVGVILSGMLSDGVEGLKAINDAGGYCIVQSPADADFPSMPTNALSHVDVDFVGTAQEIASFIMEISLGRNCS
ncbi:Chemotaxis response regulator protein-glutamate methylesterase [Pirellula sp. SH-Sr6A]|uniref:chemotaxis protein CheB n=1 Tax=Pirellula sp. SH-Sr6A TaxID=1632865 RepID=UPI00078B4F62|nr:chemotaxis protein CheB [Pirellula sp. SH-Sr6A]AMV31499.1 Chemotaxis response regulator protein-glutamate methylesterase [Pirellula sp. SH-Sr6A]